MATSVGVPHTAAVGCSAPTSASTVPLASRADSVPRTAVARCCRLANLSRAGWAATVSWSHSGASDSRTLAAAYSCSSVSLAEASSAAPSPASCAGSLPRGAVPASTSELTSRPCRLISSSGVAPTSPVQANV